MVDFDSEHVSIERCRELLGAESRNVSDNAIQATREHAETLAHLLIDMWLDQQRNPALAELPVRSCFGRETESV